MARLRRWSARGDDHGAALAMGLRSRCGVLLWSWTRGLSPQHLRKRGGFKAIKGKNRVKQLEMRGAGPQLRLGAVKRSASRAALGYRRILQFYKYDTRPSKDTVPDVSVKVNDFQVRDRRDTTS